MNHRIPAEAAREQIEPLPVRRKVLAFLAACSLSLAFASAASASQGSPHAVIHLSQDAGPKGARVVVFGKHFRSNSKVAITANDRKGKLLSNTRTDGQGKLKTNITIPKRRWGMLRITAAQICCGIADTTTYLLQPEWPQFRYGPARNAAIPQSSITPSSVSRMDRQWSRAVGSGVEVGSPEPVVGEGIAYYGRGRQLFAIDTNTGEILWSSRRLEGISEGIGTSPALVGGLVVAGSRYGLHAFDTQTGAGVWDFPPQGYQGVVSNSPAVYRNTIFFAMNGLNPKTDRVDATVYSLNPMGHENWHAALDQGEVKASVVVGGGLVFVPTLNDSIVALNANTGAEAWRFQVPPFQRGYMDRTPSYHDGRLYFSVDAPNNSTGPRIYALDSATGNLLWSGCGCGPFNRRASAPLVIGNRVYFVGLGDSASQAGVIYGFSTRTGALEVSREITGPPQDGDLTANRQLIFICDRRTDRFGGVAAYTFDLVRVGSFGFPCDVTPVPVGSNVLVADGGVTQYGF